MSGGPAAPQTQCIDYRYLRIDIRYMTMLHTVLLKSTLILLLLVVMRRLLVQAIEYRDEPHEVI